MKKILLVIPGWSAKSSFVASQEYFVHELRLQVGSSAIIEVSLIKDMIFDISNDNCSIIDVVSGNDISNYNFVIIRNVGKMFEQGVTLANYLAMKGIPFIDSYLETRGSGKLACSMLCRRHNISIPRTIYASSTNLGKYINDNSALFYPFILKSDNGRKGRDNYLIKTPQELNERLSSQPGISFVAQEFIENDGDYRALVMDGKITLVIKRIAVSNNTHLNNISQGGLASLESVSVFSDLVCDDILKSAAIEGLEVAGVDIIFNKTSGNHYFLEVNRSPQISTGSFILEKTTTYAEMINKRLNRLQDID